MTDTRQLRWPLIIGGISVYCRWSIGWLSYNISQKFSHCQMYKLNAFHPYSASGKKKLKTWDFKFNFLHRTQAKVKSPPPGRLCKSNSPLPGQRGGGTEVEILIWAVHLVSSDNPADWAWGLIEFQLSFDSVLWHVRVLDNNSRSAYRPKYRPSVGRDIDRHLGWIFG